MNIFTFPDFSQREMLFFPVEIFHFGTPLTNFNGFKKVTRKKKGKKRSSAHFHNFSLQLTFYPYNFLCFSIYPFFPCFSRLVCKSFPVKNVRGHCVPCPPPACYATEYLTDTNLKHKRLNNNHDN